MSLSALVRDINPSGVLKSNPTLISFTVAATSVTLWTLSTGRQAVLMSVAASRRSGNASALLQVGTGDFTQNQPDLNVFAGQVASYTLEDSLVPIIYETNITGRVTSAAASANDVRVQVAVWEF